MVTSQETCIPEILLQWIISRFSRSPLTLRKLIHKCMCLIHLRFLSQHLLRQMLQELEISWEEYVSLTSLHQVGVIVLFLMWLFQFLRHNWSIYCITSVLIVKHIEITNQ